MQQNWRADDTAWQTCTPAVTIGGGAISLGNAYLLGRHMRRGKSVLIQCALQLGSTTSYDSAVGGARHLDAHRYRRLLDFIAHAGGPLPCTRTYRGGVHGLVVQNATGVLNFLTSTGPGASVASADTYVVNATLTSASNYIAFQAEYART